MQAKLIEEARRQAEICNACRYCEGYCVVFPALHRERVFADGDLTQLANLCHNCRGCYYACQYTTPHEFDLNLPKVLAELRQASWADCAWPTSFARLFQRSGVAVAIVAVIGFAILLLAMRALGPAGGESFYAVMSHGAMVAIFLPAFLLPLVSIAVSLRRYWQRVGGGKVTLTAITAAIRSAATMKNLAGGHGEGCNYEDEDRFSQARRIAHQAVMYGFLLCFLSTVSGTVLHYLFDAPAPYGFWSLPKLLGLPGGLLMVVGSVWLAALKLRAERHPGDAGAFGGEMAFILLLFFVAISGLVLYWLGATVLMPILLALHLGAVLSFFLLTSFTKMAHGFYRMAALVLEESKRQRLSGTSRTTRSTPSHPIWPGHLGVERQRCSTGGAQSIVSIEGLEPRKPDQEILAGERVTEDRELTKILETADAGAVLEFDMTKVTQSADRCLATYGTLAPGRVNNDQLAGLTGQWREGKVKGRLVDAGWGAAHGCPGLILDAAGDLVDVHVFQSPDLPHHWPRLDDFEGPGYRRVVTQVQTSEGDLEASIYVLNL